MQLYKLYVAVLNFECSVKCAIYFMTVNAQVPPDKHDVCMGVSVPRRVWRGHVAGKAVQGALAEDLGWNYFLEHGEHG